MDNETLIPAEVQEQAEQAQVTLTNAQTFKITNHDDYRVAAAQLVMIKGRFNKVEASRVKLKAPALETCRQIDAFFREPLKFLRAAETAIKGEMSRFSDEQDRIAREEQRKREEAERQRQAEIDRKRREDEEAAMALAEEAEAKGDHEAAAEIIEEVSNPPPPEPAPAPAPIRQAPKADGIQMRDNWKAEVTNLEALVRAVATGQAPIATLQANDKVLGQTARALKGTVEYPGVRFYNDKTIVASSR